MKNIVLIGLTLFGFSLFAQNKTFTMEDAVINQYTTLAPERLQQLQWVKGTDSYSYIADDENDESLVMGSAGAGSNTTEVVLALADLNTKLQALGGKNCKRFPPVNWLNAEEFEFELSQNIYRFNIKSGNLSHTDSLALPADAENRDKAPQSGIIAFTKDHNLYILNQGKVIPVSENENKGIVSGQIVSRNEFGINKGTYWSPDGSKLAYYVKDETEVNDYPVIDWTKKPATVEYIKYPMAGDSSSEKVYVHIYDVNSGKSIQLKTGDPQQYLTNIAWSPDSREVYIAHLNRDQNHMELKRYDSQSGEMEATLFEEKSDQYVEPLQPVHFVPGDDDLFIWESSRSGFNHLYLYNTKGKLKSQLTSGNWTVTDFQGFDEKGEYAFFTSTAVSPLNRDLYRVSIKKGNPERLTKGSGTHMTQINDRGNYFIDNFSSTTEPRKSSIEGIGNGISFTLKDAEDPLTEYQLGEMRMITLKDRDGGDLFGRMYLPVDFDSTKKYPVVVYLYGGPHVQMVRNYWLGGGNLWFQYMAQRGYIVWTLDNRGSGYRGQAWEQNTFRQLGTVEMEDQLQGINFLKNKSYVDTARMGIHGWSFGGFMTMSMMSRQPGIFKAGVAGGPVIDWSYYEVMYTERYMDTPEQNPEGFKSSNLMNYIDDLQGHLLVIHGTSDPVVLWQHTQLYLKEAVEKGKQLDYFVYPMHEHNVRGKDRVHLMQKVTDYFEEYLR